MRVLRPGKGELRLLPSQTSETVIARVIEDTGIFMGLAEALSFQLEKIRSFTVGPDRMQLNRLKNLLDAINNQHRAAEKKANPEGYAKYDNGFDESAGTIIDLLTALQKGEIKVEQTSTDKAA